MQMKASALSKLRVLDLTRVRAGPTCCRIFADFGADVIKIEAPPGVDPNEGMSGARDGSDMQNLHRNKRSITLNLKTPAGLDVFKRLVKTADIVVENFRPDVKHRLGIGYDDLKAINPRIILASISGFGETGPYRTRAGFDQIAQGMGGLMWVTGLPEQGPVRAGIAIADTSAGLFAAIGILVALAEREQSGEGQWICASLLQAQVAMMDFQAARYLIDGVVPQQAGNDHPYSTPMGVVRTADGYINIAVGGPAQWKSSVPQSAIRRCGTIRAMQAKSCDCATERRSTPNSRAFSQRGHRWIGSARSNKQACRRVQSTRWMRSSTIRRSSTSASLCPSKLKTAGARPSSASRSLFRVRLRKSNICCRRPAPTTTPC
jgi:crotonobetainyl-CoA:carnitine CoA-transferase CaiB-like acyl-CoA transferase